MKVGIYMDNSLKNEIVTLSNGNKYFVLEEVEKDGKTYDFLLNIDDENKIEIVFQDLVDSKLILKTVKNDLEKEIIKNLFREIIYKK